MTWLDLRGVKEQTNDFEPVPSGTYIVQTTSAEIKQTKDGTGEYINVTMRVLGPTHTGRLLFAMFNIKNKSEKAVEIGFSQLKSLLKASGVTFETIDSPTQLCGLTMRARVGIEKDDYGSKNKVFGYDQIENLAVNVNVSKTQNIFDQKIPF